MDPNSGMVEWTKDEIDARTRGLVPVPRRHTLAAAAALAAGASMLDSGNASSIRWAHRQSAGSRGAGKQRQRNRARNKAARAARRLNR